MGILGTDDLIEDYLLCDICNGLIMDYSRDLYHFSGIISNKFSGHIHLCKHCVTEMKVPVDLNFDEQNWNLKNRNGKSQMNDKQKLTDKYTVRLAEVVSTTAILVVLLIIFSSIFTIKNDEYVKEVEHKRTMEILSAGEKFFILNEMDNEDRKRKGVESLETLGN